MNNIIENMEKNTIKVMSIDTNNMTYTCDDGNTYHYAEFISRYKKMGTYKVDEDE